MPSDRLSRPNLLIIGASTRAAAFSALRAGWQPICLDQFADADLQAHAVAHRIDDYPAGLMDAIEAIPPCPTIYVGGLENRPDIIQTVSRLHPLWGNDAETLARCREPSQLSEVLQMARIGAPQWRDHNDPPPKDGTWMIRPISGSGGRGIHVWTEDASNVSTLLEPHGFQQRIEGTPCSAVFVAVEPVGDVRFVGVTRQLIGENSCHAEPYRWCGNIGPVTLSVSVEHLIRRVGNLLKWKLGLRGLFGVDFLVDADDVPWVTEVNPRYPASTELLEFATGYSLFAEHCRAFSPNGVPETSCQIVTPTAAYLGKAILYAREKFLLTCELTEEVEQGVDEFPEFADLPFLGQEFSAGEPICTVFATARSVEECWDKLQWRLSETESLVFA